MGTITCSGNVPFLLLLRFVKILSFMISWEWIRSIGLDVCFGMVGFLSCLVLMVPLLWLLVLLIVLVTLLNLHLVATLLVFLQNGVPLLSLMLLRLPLCFLILPMFGLMGGLFLIVLLVCPLLALGFLLVNLLPIGIIGVGAMLIRFARLVIFRLVMVFALFQDLCSLFKELKCGVSFWLCSPLVRYTWC